MKKAFGLIDLMVAMGIVAVLATLGFAALVQLQRSARDQDRRTIALEMVEEIERFKVRNFVYPESAEVSFNADNFEILDGDFSLIDLNGHLTADQDDPSSSSTTKYYYEKIDGQDDFKLCVMFESGTVESFGTIDCDPDDL